MLPILSRAQDDPARLRRQYRVCVQAAAAAGVMFTLPPILVGEQLVKLLYGGKYQGTGVFVALLGAAVAVRFLRFVPAVVATAKADTMNQLYSNLWRGASLPLALGVVAVGGTPVQIAACAVVAVSPGGSRFGGSALAAAGRAAARELRAPPSIWSPSCRRPGGRPAGRGESEPWVGGRGRDWGSSSLWLRPAHVPRGCAFSDGGFPAKSAVIVGQPSLDDPLTNSCCGRFP